MVLEIIIFKFSCILKIMSRNTFPEPQPDSASYMGGFCKGEELTQEGSVINRASLFCSCLLLPANVSLIYGLFSSLLNKVESHYTRN